MSPIPTRDQGTALSVTPLDFPSQNVATVAGHSIPSVWRRPLPPSRDLEFGPSALSSRGEEGPTVPEWGLETEPPKRLWGDNTKALPPLQPTPLSSVFLREVPPRPSCTGLNAERHHLCLSKETGALLWRPWGGGGGLSGDTERKGFKTPDLKKRKLALGAPTITLPLAGTTGWTLLRCVCRAVRMCALVVALCCGVCACVRVRARARAHLRARSSLSAEMRCVSRASSLFGETVGVCLDVAGCCWFVKASRRGKLGK